VALSSARVAIFAVEDGALPFGGGQSSSRCSSVM